MGNKKFYFFLVFLCIISIGGAYIVYLGTARSGPGVSADSTLYLSVSENLLRGQGIVTFDHTPFTLEPPLYPVVVAAISFITRADVFITGWRLNIALFILIVFFSGILFWKLYQNRIVLAYVGGIITATSLALIDMCASILSDPLLLLLVLGFLLAAAYFAQTQNIKYFIWMGLLACLASLERYAGLALILTGMIYIFYFYWGNYRRGLLSAGLFSLSGMPILLWGIFFNYRVSGRLIGYSPLRAIFTMNLYLIGEKISYWFLPYHVIKAVTPLGLLAVVLLILILLNRGSRWKNWFQRIIGKSEAANSIFFIIYLCVMIFLPSSYEIGSLGSQRYHIILLPSLLIVLFGLYEELIPPRLGSPSASIKDWVFIPLLILWLVYPASKIQTYIRDTGINGEINYNSYNYANIKESDFLRTAEGLPENQNLYSNYEKAAWFFLRRDIAMVPKIEPKTKKLDPNSVAQFQDSIGPDGGGYIIWFKTINYKDNIPSLNQLNQTIKMDMIFASDIGDVYYIASRNP